MPAASTEKLLTANAAPNDRRPARRGRLVAVGRVEDLPLGRGATVELADNTEVALYHTDAGFYAIENFCPHRGAALADGDLEGCAVACHLHGWRFDVRSGKCLTHAGNDLERYDVRIEAGEIKILI